MNSEPQQIILIVVLLPSAPGGLSVQARSLVRCSAARCWYKSGHHAGLKIQPLNIAKNLNRGEKKDLTNGTDTGTLLLSSVRRLMQNIKTSVDEEFVNILQTSLMFLYFAIGV